MSYQDIVAAMHYYVELGLPVIPICSHDHRHVKGKHLEFCKCMGKTPLIAGWQQKSDTSTENINEWVRQFKEMNVGLPLGEASGYCGIDVDGPQGEQLLQSMSGGDLPETWEFVTGAGRRLIYQIPIGMKTKKFKITGSDKHNECAILCTGQQTVLPPSIHHTGREYVWIEDRDPQNLDCAMAPKWLLDLIRLEEVVGRPQINYSTAGLSNIFEEEFIGAEFDSEMPEDLMNIKSSTVKKQKNSEGDTTEVEKILYQTIAEGSRDNTMTKIIGHFLSRPEYRMMPIEMFTDLMLNYNSRYCDPPLDDNAIIVKIKHISEMEAQKSAQFREMRTKKEFHASHVAQMLMNLFKDQEALLIEYELMSGNFYTCAPYAGPWKTRSGAYLQSIRALVRKYLRLPQYGDPSWDKEHYINETLSAIKDLMLTQSTKEDYSFDLHANQEMLKPFIMVGGKLLDWRRGEILPWDPKYRSTINFNVVYDPDAKCPNWERYMEQWVPDKGSRDLLQEFLGYCLIPDTKLETFLILTGSGSNGKSMLLNFIKTIFEDSCSNLSTSKMVERFGKAALKGKLINICTEDEGDNGYLRHTDEIKALVSGEEVVAEYKGKDLFSFRNIARLIFSTNNIPKSRDRTHGWYRRQIIINFPNRFVKDMNISREMEFNMQAERSGIFNWMVEGLRRVMLRGDLELPEQIKLNAEEFKAINDPLEGFLKECTRIMGDADLEAFSRSGERTRRLGISTNYLYRVYEFWCEDNYGDRAKQMKMVQRNFTERIHKEKGIPKDKGSCVVKGDNKQQCFFGILLDIKDQDLRERMITSFTGYGAAEPEAKIRDFIAKTS